MKQEERLEIFEKLRAKYSVFLLSVLWKLTGDRELFRGIAVPQRRAGAWRPDGARFPQSVYAGPA